MKRSVSQQRKRVFVSRLIEKDYFCTLILLHTLAVPDTVFKGGTCLAKVHANFYRLSEDLDFTISAPVGARRGARGDLARPFRQVMEAIPAPFRMAAPVEGHNSSTQYSGVVSYSSLLDGHEEQVLLDLSLREPLLMPVARANARTLLRDPVGGGAMLPVLPLPCIAKTEAFAEKFRAALSRRDVAVRDFYDLDYAVQRLHLQPFEASLVELTRRKLAIPGNDPVDVSPR